MNVYIGEVIQNSFKYMNVPNHCVLKPYRHVDNTNTSSGKRHENEWAAAVVGITICRTWRSSLPAKLLHTGAPQREARQEREQPNKAKLNRNKWMYVWWKYWSAQTTFSKGPVQWMDNYRGQLPEKRATPVCKYVLLRMYLYANLLGINISMYICLYIRTVCI